MALHINNVNFNVHLSIHVVGSFMLNQFIYLVVASILAVIFHRFIHVVIIYIDYSFVYLQLLLSAWFKNISYGDVISKVLLLTLFPIGLIYSIQFLCHHILKSKMRQPLYWIWLTWFIIVISILFIR